MIYLSQTLYLWGLAAFGLGVAIAIFGPRGDERRGGVLLWGVVALFALAAAAVFWRAVPGRAGLWLETGVLALAAYGVGCLVGAALVAPFEIGARVLSPTAASVAAASLRGRLRASVAKRAAPAPASEPAGVVTPAFLKRIADADPAGEDASPISAAAATAAAEVVAQAFLDLIAAGAPRAAAAAPAPQKSAPAEPDARGRPPAIARPEAADDLWLIRGVDRPLSQALNGIGVWRFAQIAAWGPEEVEWVARRFGDNGGVAPKHWPPQARLLAAGVLTDHARAARAGAAPGPGDDADLAAWVAALPQPAPPGAGDGFYAGARPAGFLEPPLGEKDDLTRLSGVDAEMAARLNGLGVWTLGQIARWSPDNTRWIGAYFATPGLPEREDWVGQACALSLPNGKLS